VGGTVAMVDFSTVALFRHTLSPLLAVNLGFFVGVACHFCLNKYWVFRCRRNDYLLQLLQYALVVMMGWFVTISVVRFCLATFTHNVLVAKLCAIPCATLLGFVLMHLLVFGRNQAVDEPERTGETE
jgi:putative flippase GtrA